MRSPGVLEYRTVKVMDSPFNTNKLLNDNITLFDNTVALKLNIEGSIIESLTCVDKDTLATMNIHSKCFVTAAGGLANVQLLLHSFEDLHDELIFNYKNIGAAISTHPKAEVGKIILNGPIDEQHPLLRINKKDGYYTRNQLGLSYQTLVDNNLLNHCLRVDSLFRDRSIRMLERAIALVDKMPFISLKSGVFAKALISIGMRMFKTVESFNVINLKSNELSVRCFFDQMANESNCIKLSDKKSRYGLPLVTVNWCFSSSDWENVDSFMKIISKEIEESGIGVFEYKKPNNYIGIHSHFMGGTIMGRSAENSVVDENLKVHGIDNLYVSGPSVFPSYGYSNPFYTISALSIRLGEYIEKHHVVHSGI